MKACWRWIRGVSTLLLVAVGMLSGARPASALESGKAYWFVETLSVNEVALPAGVVIRTSDPASSPRGSLILENQSETLLFVLALNYKDALVMATPDPDWKARMNLAHEVASYLATSTRPAYLDMPALTDLDPHLVDRNVLALDPPPADVVIPAAQKSELLLVYDMQVFQVPFTVSYALNTGFHNASQTPTQWLAQAQVTDGARAAATQQARAAAERAQTNKMIVLGLAGLAAILIIVLLVLMKLFRLR